MIRRFSLHVMILSMTYVMLYYVSTVLDYKLVHLWIFEVPAPFIYFNFIYPLSDAITEVYGPKTTWTYLLTGFAIAAAFILFTALIIALPNPSDAALIVVQGHYDFLSQTMLKCLGFGYLAFFVGMFINVKLLSKWKLRYKGKYYYMRSFIASCLSEIVVILLGQFLIWGNRLPLHELMYTILNGYPFIMATTVIWSFFGMLIKNALYLIEGNKPYLYNKELLEQLNVDKI